MRIGLFTDTYRPSINGIVYVIDSLKRELEALGHEVFIICPGGNILPGRSDDSVVVEDDRIIRLPSLKGAFFDDYDTSVFFPTRVVRQIRELELDVVHIFTPSQVGLIGARAAAKCGTPFIMQHSTDLYEFSEDYPAVLPGILALATLIMPTSIKLSLRDKYEMAGLYRPRRSATKWNKDIVQKAVTVLYSRADAVIALSRKSVEQLQSWQEEEGREYNITLMPNGVDALPRATAAQVRAFQQEFNIAEDDEVYGFVGRLGKEKNLDVLIEALPKVLAKRPKARLLFVGDFEYRETLEAHAEESGYGDRITFTGALPRETLNVAYNTLDAFTFPSLKDTQGWVLHEAAHARLPILLIDKDLSEVVVDGKNGYFVEDSADDIADRLITLFSDAELRKKMGASSKRLANKYTEKKQVQKLEKLYTDLITHHQTLHQLDEKHEPSTQA